MKLFRVLLPLLFLMVLFSVNSCEETDTTPPSVTLTSPTNGSTVGEIVIVTCMSTDDVGVEKVELWVNGVSTGIEDNSEPYSLEWDTTPLDDGIYTLIVRSYDDSENTSDSDPVVVTVDNLSSTPLPGSIYFIKYGNNSFTIRWSQNMEDDFSSYTLLESSIEDMSSSNEIYSSTNREDTVFTVESVGDGESRFYQVQVEDIYSLKSLSPIVEGVGYGLILFVSDYEGGELEIYTMDIRGNNITNISSHENQDYYPIWFPTSDDILFLRKNNSNILNLHRMTSDGQNQVRLVDESERNWIPSISSDGLQIVYRSTINGVEDIFVMDSDGNNKTKLTNSDRYVYEPKFSPDNSQIVYSSSLSGENDMEIFIMNSDGSNKQRLTNSPGRDLSPEFSPDGNKISFYSERDGNLDIYLMNVDGSDVVNISNSQDTNVRKQFSPDGSYLVYGSNKEVGREIMLIDLGNMSKTQLTNNHSINDYPKFTPDGSKIIFSSRIDGDFYELYLMDIDGSNLSRLTHLEGTSSIPSFQP